MIVSKFSNYRNTTPSDINMIDWLRDNTFAVQVEKIRLQDDKSVRDRLKAQLPAITPSGTFTSRSEANLIRHSGFIQFDVDKVSPEDISQLKSRICQMPYTFYCGLSVSGRGLWGLFRISQHAKHKQHFKAMERYFNHYGITIDGAPSNVASLRGYSYDWEGYLNETAETFAFIFEEPKATKSDTIKKAGSSTSNNSVADHFNQHGEIESLLIAHGWKFAGRKGSNNRYTRPGKTTGISGNYCTERKLFFVWSTDPETGLTLDTARAFNHWAVYVQLVCHGDQRQAARNLSRMGYGHSHPSMESQSSVLMPNIDF